jgi:hypothetical protein
VLPSSKSSRLIRFRADSRYEAVAKSQKAHIFAIVELLKRDPGESNCVRFALHLRVCSRAPYTPAMQEETTSEAPNETSPHAEVVETAVTSQIDRSTVTLSLYAALASCIVGFMFWKLGDTFDRGSAVWVGEVLFSIGIISIVPIHKLAADLRESPDETYRKELISGLGTKEQAKAEPDFFARLVKINFTYIETYYRQTQVQADKSFRLSAVAALVSLGVTVGGILMM